MGKPQIEKHVERSIIKLYKAGKTYNEISELLNVGKTTIIRCLKRNDVELSGCGIIRIDPEIKQGVIKAIESGIQIKDIQSKYNISYHMVKKILLEAGIKLPGSGYKYLSQEVIDKVIELYNSHTSIEDIGKVVNRAYGTVNKIVDRYCIRHADVGKRESHSQWKGGRIIHGNYVLLRLSKEDPYFEMCNSSGYVMEHRYIMAKSLGRPLTRKETIHHIDGNTTNNDLSNLQLRQANHGKGQKYICCDCGSTNIKSEKI